MKKTLLALALLVSPIFADTTNIIGPGPAPSPIIAPSNPGVYYHIGALNLTVPWDTVNAVYMYDLEGKRNLAGGEAVIATLWHLQGTVGAVTSLDGHGAPYVGGNLWLPNPLPALAILNTVQPGVFCGYDWNKEAVMFGFKAAINVF